MEGAYDLESDVWFFVSDDVKDLIRQLLTYEPSDRVSAQTALKHPWFEKY